MTQISHLTTRYPEGNLYYKISEVKKESCLETITAFVLSIITWPVYLLGAIFIVVYNAASYCQLILRESRTISILNNDVALNAYAQKKLQKSRNELAACIEKAFKLTLSFQKQVSSFECEMPNLINPDQFCETFFHSFTSIDLSTGKFPALSKEQNQMLETLQAFQIRIKALHERVATLQDPEQTTDAVKNILALSLLKTTLKKEECKTWFFRSFLWLLPTGAFWDVSYNLSKDQEKFKGNKEYLPSPLNTYEDVVEAHNDLTDSYKYLSPYQGLVRNFP